MNLHQGSGTYEFEFVQIGIVNDLILGGGNGGLHTITEIIAGVGNHY